MMNKIFLAMVMTLAALSTACTTTGNVSTHHHPDYEKLKVGEVISDSEHQDKVHITGKIISNVKCGTFSFEGEHGRVIQIRVDPDDIPDKGLLFNSSTIIHGEVMKVPDNPVHLETDKIHYVF